MSTNVGSVGISLDLEVSSRLEKQIGTISENIAANLKTNIEKSVQKTDLSKSLGKTFTSITKKSMDVGSKIGKNLVDGIKNATKKASESANVVKPAEASNPVKTFKGLSKDDLIIKRDNSIAMQENINAQIESLRAKLKQLQNINVDGSLSDDLLKIESRMISLTDKSDRLTVDIRQLDGAIDGFDTNEVTNQTSKASKSIDKMTSSVRRSQRPLINMRSIGASLARNFLGLQLLITLVGQAVRKMAQAFWNSLKTNEEFKKSLSQIKGNLATAFQPIFQAIMPAINALMRGLSKATAYLATFISLLFGKSVKAMNASAKAMANANKEASRMVAGFDQLNDITENNNDSSNGSISPVNIDEAEVSKIQSVMNKIKSIFENTFGSLISRIAERSSELFNKILPSLQTAIENVKTLFTNVFTDIQDAAGKFFPLLIEQYKVYIDNLFTVFTPLIEFIVSAWKDLSQIMLDVWNKYGKDILNGVGEFIVGLMDTINKIWTHIINPIIKPAIEMLVKLWDEHLKDLIIQIADFVGYAITESLKFYNKFIKPIVDWLIVTLGPVFAWVFENIFKTVGTIFGRIFDNISGTLTKLKGIFGGILTFLEGVFTGNWSKIFEGLGQIIKNIFSGLGDIILMPFRSIRDNLNTLIRNVNKVKVPDWIPLIGGKSINIPEIPKFASGGVLKQPTLNIAGEYPGASSNPEIVTPQNIMAETFRDVMREFMNEFRQTGNISTQAVNLIVNIGGKKMLEQLIKLVEDYEKQTGKEFNFNV